MGHQVEKINTMDSVTTLIHRELQDGQSHSIDPHSCKGKLTCTAGKGDFILFVLLL